MKRNGIECEFKHGYAGTIRVLECYFYYRYGPQRQFSFFMGAIRIPILSRVKMEKFMNDVTRAIAVIWGVIPPRQGRNK